MREEVCLGSHDRNVLSFLQSISVVLHRCKANPSQPQPYTEAGLG